MSRAAAERPSSLRLLHNEFEEDEAYTVRNLQLPQKTSIPAKVASMVAVISNGRLELGIGAGWYGHGYLGFGYQFKASVRIGVLDEAIQIIEKMWTEPEVSFEEKYYWL